jgi:hypothetical protein
MVLLMVNGSKHFAPARGRLFAAGKVIACRLAGAKDCVVLSKDIGNLFDDAGKRIATKLK